MVGDPVSHALFQGLQLIKPIMIQQVLVEMVEVVPGLLDRIGFVYSARRTEVGI